MSKISKNKIEKIKNDILYVLFESGLNPLYTKNIADEVVRDKEFVLKLLEDLERNNLIKRIGNKKRKWIMKDEVYKKYKELFSGQLF